MIVFTLLTLVSAVSAQGTAKIHVFDYVEDELTGPGDPVLVLKESKPPASILFERPDEMNIDLHSQSQMTVETYDINASSYDMYLERNVEGSVGYQHPIPGTLNLKAGENAVISIDEDKDDVLKGNICRFGDMPTPKLDTAVMVVCLSYGGDDNIDNFKVIGSNTGCHGCKIDNELPSTRVLDSLQFTIDDTNFDWNLTLYYKGRQEPICSLETKLGPGGVYLLNVKSPETASNNTVDCIIGPPLSNATDFWQPIWIPLVVLIIIILIVVVLACLNVTYPRIREELLRKMGRWTPEDDTKAEQEKKSTRLNSLDTFRGLAITIMIFVNYGGGGYFFLEHAAWNGLSLADFVFPWFMFMVGVSIVLSVQSQLKKGVPKKVILEKVFIRFIKLFVIGALLNTALPGGVELAKWRFPGVLQRIAFTYLVCSVLEILFIPNLGATEHVGGERMTVSDDQNEFTETGKFLSDTDYPEKKMSGWKFGTRVAADAASCRGKSLLFYTWPQWILVVIITAIWCGVTLAVAAPNCPQGYMGPGGLADGGRYPNCTGGIAGYIDRLIFGSHIYQHPTCKAMYKTTQAYDPEGLLGSLTSILTVYTGVLAGHVVVTCKSSRVGLLLRMIILTLCSLIIGLVLCKGSLTEGWIPLNKNLWTPSFVMITSSSAYGILALCYFLVDFTKLWCGTPFRAAGKNPLFLYVGSSVLYHFFPFNWATDNEHGPLMLQAIVGTLCWILVGVYLDCKKKYYKL